MSVKIKGLKELQQKLNDLSRAAEELDGNHQLTLPELFPDYFMLRFTNFASIQEMFDKSGFEVNSQEDFEKVPEDAWDNFVQDNTQFEDWEEMKQTAAIEWAQKKMGFDPGSNEE